MTRALIPTTSSPRARVHAHGHALAGAVLAVALAAGASARALAQTTRPQTEDAESWVVTGRVVDANDKAVAGVAIFLTAWSGPEASPTSLSLRRVRTDSSGNFSVGLVPPPITRTVRVELESDALEPFTFERTVAAFGAAPELLTLRALPFLGSDIDGVVRDEAGAAIAGAEISLPDIDRQATSGADGTYKFEHIRCPSGPKRVNTSAAGYVRAFETAFVAERHAHIETALRRGGTVMCVVVDGGGEPIAGATVVASQGAATQTTMAITGAHGRAATLTLAPGAANITATATDFMPQRQSVDVPAVGGAPLEVRLVLTPGRSVSGRVVDTAGKPLRNVWVNARTPDDTAVTGQAAFTDPDGRFQFADLPNRELRLAASLPGYARTLKAVGDGDATVLITMPTRDRLAGLVMDRTTRQPIEHFNIRLVPGPVADGERHGATPTGPLATTGRDFDSVDGKWAIDDQPFDEGAVYGIEIRAPGYCVAEVPRLVAGGPPYSHTNTMLTRLSTVGGTIVNARARPVPQARIWALTKDRHDRLATGTLGQPEPDATTDDNGTFVLPGVAPGTFHLLVVPGQLPPLEIGPFQLAVGQTITDLAVAIPDAAAISGTVVGRDGKPLADARVEVNPGQPVPGCKTMAASTDADGRFSLRDLPAGPLRLVAFEGNSARGSAARFVTLAPGTTSTVAFAFNGLCSVRVVVGGADLTGFDVHVRLERPASGSQPFYERSVLVRAATVDVDDLSPGEYRVVVTAIRTSPMRGLIGSGHATLAPGTVPEVHVDVGRW